MRPVSSASGTNSIGGTRPALGVLPADQRLEAEQAHRVEVEHRLVVHAQLAALERAVERVAGAQVVDRAVVRRARRTARRGRGPCSLARYIAASALRSSVSGVSLSPPDSAMPMLAVTNTSPSTSATGFAIASREALGDQLDGLLARSRSGTGRELVAAEARDDVGRAHRGAQPVGHRHEQAVAGRVAEAVVDHLEAVEVEEQHRDALVRCVGARELAPEALDEVQRGSAAR